ncbi:uncharacterized protein LOC116060419 isoform X22 [Sander lucioperca]|uniref:uncharacterized protein LOC116060419 isoform X22 n=1 Tax=Sander lucioperca TaxID=283035 RepID=UPI001653D641|nr:uncharacterized protein LOC116060419 isoform X22 [Sander lucioperca]
MKELRSQSLRMNSLQDESSGTKTSSEKDDSDFMCPDSGLKTQDCTSVKCSQVMEVTLVDVGSMSLRGIGLNLRHQTQQVHQTQRCSTTTTELGKHRLLLWIDLSSSSSAGFLFLCIQAARDRPEPETPNTTSPPQPESRGRIGLYCGLTAALLGFCFCRCLLREQEFSSKFKGGLRKSYSSAGGSMETVSSTTSKRQRHRNYEGVC